MKWTAPTVATAAILLAACNPARGPQDHAITSSVEQPPAQQLGAIAGCMEGDPQISVRVNGRTVIVNVITYGDGCYQRGETQLSMAGMVADIRPYDLVPPPGTICTRQLVAGTHEAHLNFESGGVARIRVHGYDVRTRDAQNMPGTAIVVVRTVEIR